MRITIIAAAGLALAGGAVAAQDADLGKELAGEFCARCHDISEDGAWKEYPPSFASIAKFRPEDQIRGRIWFPSVHSSMPEMSIVLDRDGVDALTMYILSLDDGAE